MTHEIMRCKNCSHQLSNHTKYCEECGAKVILERITFKKLIIESFNQSFGWDNRYFLTFIGLLLRPHQIIKDYLQGVRKRYLNPFAFFAIGAAARLLVFSIFIDEYMDLIAISGFFVGYLSRKDTIPLTV